MTSHTYNLSSSGHRTILFQMSTMPGLPTRPCFYDIDLDLDTGYVVGLMWKLESIDYVGGWLRKQINPHFHRLKDTFYRLKDTFHRLKDTAEI